MALFTLLVLPSFLFAQTNPQVLQKLIAELQAKIQNLQEQVATLKTELEKSRKDVEAVRAELKFTRTLSRGVSGDEVRELQKFLKQFPDIYPEGLITGYFGPLTEKAVKKLQARQGLETIGVVGPQTQAKINELLASGAGASGNIPPGLLHAPGIQKKLATSTPVASKLSTPTTTPSGTIPATPAVPSGEGVSATPAVPAVPGVLAPPPPPSGTPLPPPATATTTPPAALPPPPSGITPPPPPAATPPPPPPSSSAAFPDLTILGFSSPRKVTAGQSITLGVQVRNGGKASAPPSTILMAFAQNSGTYDPSTRFYKDLFSAPQNTLNVPEIPVSGTAWVYWTTTIPQTNLASIYFVANCDPNNQITESYDLGFGNDIGETDNAGGTQMTVSQPPPPPPPPPVVISNVGVTFVADTSSYASWPWKATLRWTTNPETVSSLAYGKDSLLGAPGGSIGAVGGGIKNTNHSWTFSVPASATYYYKIQATDSASTNATYESTFVTPAASSSVAAGRGVDSSLAAVFHSLSRIVELLAQLQGLLLR